MEINENSILVTMNPFYLLAGGSMVCILAWICARCYRNTNDFKKSAQLYLPCAAILDIVLLFLFSIDILLCIGLTICGFVVLALISNYYFYH